MFDTKVMIAPNSPRLAAKAVIAPATMPGDIDGSVTEQKTSRREAPSERAAASRPGSTPSNASRIARTWNGKVRMAAATARPSN
jgi:hypothetical protein